MRPAPHRELRATWLAAAILAGGALVPPAWASAGPPLCPFRLVTGLPCPGCGLTRSLVSLLHGDVSAAVLFHPLGPVAASVLLALVIIESVSGDVPFAAVSSLSAALRRASDDVQRTEARIRRFFTPPRQLQILKLIGARGDAQRLERAEDAAVDLHAALTVVSRARRRPTNRR